MIALRKQQPHTDSRAIPNLLNDRCMQATNQLVKLLWWLQIPSIGFPFQAAMNACESTGMLSSTVLAYKNPEIQHQMMNADKKPPQ
jgi:hypothetical protein